MKQKRKWPVKIYLPFRLKRAELAFPNVSNVPQMFELGIDDGRVQIKVVKSRGFRRKRTPIGRHAGESDVDGRYSSLGGE